MINRTGFLLGRAACAKIISVAFVASALFATAAFAQAANPSAPPLKEPNPYGPPQRQWAATPDGTAWGSTSGIELGPNGEAWTINRCGANSCEGNPAAPIYQLDLETGKVLAAIGGGLFAFPHGLDVDGAGNVWVTDAITAGKMGDQVIELSPDGKELMRLGIAGVAGGGPGHLNEPSDVLVAPNGDIFVADGHNGQNAGTPPTYVSRIVKFGPDGKFLADWGQWGSGPGEFKTPHGLAMDSRGDLYVADRGNNRIQIFSPDGDLLGIWNQFGRPSGLYIDGNDLIYSIDADSSPANHPGWPRGIWIGDTTTGQVTGFVPDANAGEGIVLDAKGNLVTAVNVAPHGITRYSPLPPAKH